MSGAAIRQRHDGAPGRPRPPGGTRAPLGPAPFVFGGAVLLLAAFGFTLPHHHGALIPFPAPAAPVEASRSLRLLERPDASLFVQDAATGRMLALLDPKQDGFVHGVAHGLQVTRRRSGDPADAPFSLTLYRDHRLVLADPSDGERIEVEGFGPTNAAAWRRFLPPAAPAP